MILGSGLGGYAGQMKIECEIPYGEIPGFPVSTVEGHDGRFIFGYVGETPVAAMKGRVHYYEGYNMEEVVRAGADAGDAGGGEAARHQCRRGD